MPQAKWSILLLCLLIAFSFAQISCNEDEQNDTDDVNGPDDDNIDDDIDDDVSDDDVSDDDISDDDDDDEPPCDPSTTPIVFAHGMLEVGDAFASQSMRFAANGYCLDRIFAFDWDTITGLYDSLAKLEEFIDQVLTETGAVQVNLVGHSMGGWLGYEYCDQPANSGKVAHYVQLASGGADSLPGDVPTLNISSADDRIIGSTEVIGAENIELSGTDHLQVATSAEAFQHMYRFFHNGEEPATTEMTPTENVTLAGRIVVFGMNDPAPGHELSVYPVNPETGERLSNSPTAAFVADANGYWGPFNAEPGRHYEYVVTDPEGDWPPLHYYREPPPRSCSLVYFRAFPPPWSLLGLAFRLLPYNDEHALLAHLTVNQAVIADRDTLFVDGYDLATGEIASPEATTIAVFYFDANFNGVSDGRMAGGLYAAFPFIKVFDLKIDASAPRTIPLVFNGRSNSVLNWKSASEGITIAVFE